MDFILRATYIPNTECKLNIKLVLIPCGRRYTLNVTFNPSESPFWPLNNVAPSLQSKHIAIAIS